MQATREPSGPAGWFRRLRLLAVSAAALLAVAGAAVAARPPIELAREVDLGRMYGGWYIVATIPNGFEKGMVGPYDVYGPGPRGSIVEDFYVRRGRFDAPRKHFRVRDFVRPDSNNARWGVQILWPFRLPFLVLYVDPQYRWVLFGEESRDLGWIYARTPRISDDDYQALMRQFAARGYDTSRFRRIIQAPDQIDRPGFWSDGVRAGR